MSEKNLPDIELWEKGVGTLVLHEGGETLVEPEVRPPTKRSKQYFGVHEQQID